MGLGKSSIRAFGLASILCVSGSSQVVPPANPTTWTSIGPTKTLWRSVFSWPETSGRIKSIAIDPSGAVYVGAAVGGIWRRDGSSWTPLTDFQPTLASGVIAIDPSDANTIYVGTGEANSAIPSYYGGGILKSVDGGATWTNIIGPFLNAIENGGDGIGGQLAGGARFAALAVSPTDRNVLLGAVQMRTNRLVDSGIYRSADGGLNWSLVLTGNTGSSVVFHPTDGNIVYAALGSTFPSAAAGIYKSVDAGQTWSLLTGTGANLLPTANVGLIRLAISRSNPQILYAGIANDGVSFGHLLGLYKTSDSGTNWTKLTATPDYCAFQCYYSHAIAVHPTNPDLVVVGGDGVTGNLVYRTADGGGHWDEIAGTAPNRLHNDVQAFAFTSDGSALYVATDGGIATTTTLTAPTVTWNLINDNLAITQFYSGFDISPSDVHTTFGGTQDNGFPWFTGSLQWTAITNGEGGNVIFDAPSNTVYLPGFTLAWQPLFGIYGAAFSGTGLSTSEPQAAVLPFAINRTTSSIQYTATTRVYQTVDAQAHWAPISPVLTTARGDFLTAVAVADHNPDIVCTGSKSGRVWCTANSSDGAAATWTEYSTGLPSRYITSIVIDHFKEYIMCVTFSGFSGVSSGDTSGHIFFTSTSGATWTDISGNLPNTPVNGIVIDFDNHQLYAATDSGVFRTLDQGTTWAALAEGLPHTIVTGLLLHQPTRTLRAATMGRSMWDLLVPTISSAPGPTIALNPWRMRFSTHFGSPDPPPQSLAVMNAGSLVFGSTTLNWTASSSTAVGGAWLANTPAAGTDNGSVSVAVHLAGLPVGLYNGIVRIAGSGATNTPQDVTVLLAVTDTAPVASAGASMTYDSTMPSGASVMLDGSASHDPDNDKLTFTWTGPFGKASGPTPTVTIPTGVYSVTLTVADPAGLTASSTIQITVLSATQMTSNLIDSVQKLGQKQSLNLLQHALGDIQSGKLTPACNEFNAFENQVQAQAGKQLTLADAAQLIASATHITGALGCR
jgi:PKD domain